MPDHAADVLRKLQAAGVVGGSLVAVAVAGTGLGLAVVPDESAVEPDGSAAGAALEVAVETDEPTSVMSLIEREVRPRWVMWSGEAALGLVRTGVRVATSWDVAAVHRLIVGGWRADPARVWAWAHGLPSATIPAGATPARAASGGQDGLFGDDSLFGHEGLVSDEGDEGGLVPVGPDGHLRLLWTSGGWSSSPGHLARWAGLAAMVVPHQLAALASLVDHQGRPIADATAMATARAESTAELLCAELAVDGLPMDRRVAEELIAGFVGRRPRSAADAEDLARGRQHDVLVHAPGDVADRQGRFDLRSPAQVKALLGLIGIDVPDTRAWRLETLRDVHPIIEPLLAWRKAERISTTYGYGWLDEHLGIDGRLRGAWTASDGAAGRMTASAGLHNMPAVMRQAVVAEPGHVFVRADLGQIEPRVLAAVSRDPALARATLGDDLYAPVASQLGVDRATAKVAVLGAMYGQTTGHGARALRGLESAYPVAMGYLDAGDRAGQRGEDLRTYGGRRIRMSSGPSASSGPSELDPVAGGDRDGRSRAAARGRYGRNALVQGAAAELFKVWAVTVRARAAIYDARVVLCLHDELLLHAPAEHGEAVARLVADALQEAADRWAPDDSVRFAADISVIDRWSDAKA